MACTVIFRCLEKQGFVASISSPPPESAVINKLCFIFYFHYKYLHRRFLVEDLPTHTKNIKTHTVIISLALFFFFYDWVTWFLKDALVCFTDLSTLQGEFAWYRLNVYWFKYKFCFVSRHGHMLGLAQPLSFDFHRIHFLLYVWSYKRPWLELTVTSLLMESIVRSQLLLVLVLVVSHIYIREIYWMIYCIFMHIV